MCALLVGIGLGRESLWQDEGATWDATGRPFGATLSMIRDTETNGSIYNLVVHASRLVLGDGEAALRLPSAVFVVLLVPVVVALGRAVMSDRAALVAGAVVAGHGSVIEYGREARTYGLFMLLVAVSMLGLVRDRQTPARGWWSLWVVAGAAAVYCHLFAGLVLLVQAATVWPLTRPGDDRRRRLAGVVATGVLILPLVLIVLGRDSLEGLQYLSPIGPFILRDIAFALTGGGWVTAAVGGVGFLLAGYLLLSERTADRRRPELLLLFTWIALPALVGIIASVPSRVLVARYLVHALVPLTLLLVWLVERSSRRWQGPLAVGLVGVSLFGGLRFRVEHRNEDWRALTAAVTARAEPGDAVVFLDDFHLLVFEYYLERGGHQAPAPSGLDSVVPAVPWGAFHIEDWELPDVGQDELACAVAGRQRVWVVAHDGSSAFEGRYPMLGWVGDLYGVPEVLRFEGGVSASLFSGPSATAPGCAGGEVATAAGAAG